MNESIITFTTKDGGVVKFSTFQKLRKWLEEERQKWSWLDQDKVFGTQHFSPIKSNIGNLISTCDQVVANPEDQNARQRARQYIGELQNLINLGHFALSNTDFGRFVLEFATTDISGAVDMLRASTFSRRHGIPNDAGAIQGVMLWSLYRHGFVKKSF